jgi:TPR repeat protein
MQQAQCDQGDFPVCAALGNELIAGTAGVQDRAKGTALLRKACAGGVASACTTGDGGS